MTSTGSPATYQQVLDLLERYGLLLVSDARLPSVASLVAGEPVRGSWWGHPRGKEIYEVTNQVAATSHVLILKLVSGKETFVHQRLWSALLSVATSRESWQLDSLSALAFFLLETITREHTLRIDQVHQATDLPSKALAEAAREVERRLLVYGESFHTSSGAHTKWLESWDHWMQRTGFAEQLLPPEQGKLALEDALLILNRQFDAQGHLPWRMTAP